MPGLRHLLCRHVAHPMRLFVFAALLASPAPGASASTAIAEVTARGRGFLTSLLDTNLGLLPEYRGARVYWLYHDNYLAAKVLSPTHPAVARTIAAAMQREGVTNSGKIELLFGELKNPLPFRQHLLTDIRRAGDKVIRTEVVTPKPLAGWQQYADLLLMACIAEQNAGVARDHWNAALKMWDGSGFNDAAARHLGRYSTYKLGLALLASARLTPPAASPDRLFEKLLSLQLESGGWVTDYNAAGKKIGVENVETTCLAILGLEAAGQQMKSGLSTANSSEH